MTDELKPPDNVVPIRFKRSKDDLPTAPVKKATPTTDRWLSGRGVEGL